ncbi:MAG TPA: ATP-binding cassette domain-containing protein [Gaiellaceae bacterium]|nr:ATP-binding cassette domain-containing protein [Gaiellaceae bacterium]
MSAVEARDVFRVHGSGRAGVPALQGLTLTVEEGEVCVVLGPSGSGKSTFLRLVAGLDRPSAGALQVLGREPAALARRELTRFRRRDLGYLDQRYWLALAPHLPALDLVALHGALSGESPEGRRSRAASLLARVGLDARRMAPAAELSGGEQQRVALCAALAHRPRLLVADEPTGELDPASAGVAFALVASLAREEGCTVLLVTHDPRAASIADRVVRIRDGRVAEEARAGEESAVVGRGGWLRVPEELLQRAGIGHAARLEGADGAVLLRPHGAAAAAAVQEPPPRVAAEAGGAVVARADGVERAYDGRLGLRRIDVEVRGGRLTAVTGPSGSGKTTLLRLLAGLDVPTRGSVDVLATTLSSLDRAERARFRRATVGYVAQQPTLAERLTARETVETALALRGLDAGGAEDALRVVGLGDLAERPLGGLSNGERERVAVARALAPGPALVLADEPTARLDRDNALAIGRLLLRVARERGAAVVCASHDPVLIELADDVVALDTPRR